jgi:hypothetical protein
MLTRFALWWLRAPQDRLTRWGFFWLVAFMSGLLQAAGARFAPSRRRTAAQYARANHYFWLPCPARCGNWFGGQEWTGAMLVDSTDPIRGRGVCPRCAATGVGQRSVS